MMIHKSVMVNIHIGYHVVVPVVINLQYRKCNYATYAPHGCLHITRTTVR